ncbi:MAG: CBS domain-containing protein [Gammaproteobacteria bacterium]|nr:MAG: CBS domain-containing protein [Gammaproteobacteria bacterium]
MKYHSLETHVLTNETALDRPRVDNLEPVGLDAPAIKVVTDLSKVAAMTINPCASIDNASERMISAGVRLLFVTDQYYNVMGLITARDITGERAVMYIQEHGGKREDIMVRDIMTPRHRIEVLDYEDVLQARVGDIVETLRRLGRQHALVMQRGEGEELDRIRGIISTSQVSQQTGEHIEVVGLPTTIADLAAQR